MRKATFLTGVSFGLVVFLGTSYYYQTEYIPKGTVNIVPDDHRPSETVDDAFEEHTIIISDPTLAQKFVGSSTEFESRRGVKEIKEVGSLNNGKDFAPVESDNSGLNFKDKWPRAGEPYIVPQMTENERNLKVKRFQQPKSGVNNGH
ncbi:plasmid transfer protein HtdO [Enterobacter hormaechei]|uniref:plasmid transfer protein HtdO n=1 Tax=Enterobacter hormaechei TaxID=158836 RepID=UPI0007589E83|nr:plasmid transfer protein HtdO [Enterobacter hormaechei]KVJ68714.1 hypothetical protein AWS29_12685 [Enterobacter hormaechei subsp. steigerwaltii]HAS0791049.1 hypothetical protein [Enterobacter hormaechei subsp. steigerwaltii]